MTSGPTPQDFAQILVDRLQSALVLVDDKGRIAYANAEASKMFGYPEGELGGLDIEVLVPEAQRQRHVKLRSAGGRPAKERSFVSGLSLQARRKDGDVFDAEIALSPVKVAGRSYVCSTVRDASETGTASAYFRNLLESAPDAMIIVDSRGVIEIVNRQCQEMFGYPREDLVGQPIEFLLPERFRRAHKSHIKGYCENPHLRPMGRGMELAGRRYDGSEFPVEISLSPVQGPDGLRVSSVIRDVTARHALERELIEARQQAERANRANTAFLAAASHDLRQPVQALSLLNGALRRTVENPLAKEMVESQQHSLDAMTNLLNSLLDISRLDAGAIEPEIEDFPMRRLIDRLSSEFGRQASQKGVRFSGGDCEKTVRSDPNLLAEILQNLVSNAIRYTDAGGEVRVGCTPAGRRLQIDVVDTGLGIEADELENIFREFHQVKHQGSEVEGFGLGLAIVRRLSDLLDVEIDVESTPGVGSRFTAFVPLAEAEIVDDDEAVDLPVEEAEDISGRVLLIEDDQQVAGAWSLLLAAEGFVVDRAESANDVRELLKGGHGCPDLVISDYHLADGSTGVEAVSIVREFYSQDVPTFIVSGDTTHVVEPARSVPNSLLMRKPVDTERLLRLAREAVETGVIEED